MKTFVIIEDENKLYIKFPFDMKTIILKIVFIVLFFITILFFAKWESINRSEFFISYFICLSILIYVIINPYLEWKRNGRKLLEKNDGKLFVNNKLITDFHQIKNTIIDYEPSFLSSGWLVQFDFYLYNNDVYIKKQLSEKMAVELAQKISIFFDLEIKKLR